MKLRTTTARGLALSATLALALTPSLMGTGSASAVVKDGARSTVARHAAATTKSEQQRIVEYWTPQRMQGAIPVGSQREAKGKPGGGGGGGSSAVQETPQPRFGKVFFTEGRTNYVCSGTATTSSNQDVVTTAGHCVNEGPGAFVTNFAFVPAYNNGAAPFGTWTARALMTSDQWRTSGDFDYDIGFAVMNDLGGQSLTQAVGGYGITFNQPHGQAMKAYGYPAARPFNGQTLWSCSGTVVQDTFGGSQDQGLACDMTGGSSGGGWLTSSGLLNSVTSFGYTSVKNVLWGPYFGSVIQAVYNTASAA